MWGGGGGSLLLYLIGTLVDLTTLLGKSGTELTEYWREGLGVRRYIFVNTHYNSLSVT